MLQSVSKYPRREEGVRDPREYSNYTLYYAIYMVKRINRFFQLNSRVRASIDRDGHDNNFDRGNIHLIIFENYRTVCI